MNVTAIKTPVFAEGQDLFSFITEHITQVESGAIIVITSKIVSLAEGRTQAIKTKQDRIAAIKAESQTAIRGQRAWVTVKDDEVLLAAGVDDSNADGKLILLPKDSFATASRLRKKFQHHYGQKNIGVLITDSRSMPFRAGATGRAIGYAGFKGLEPHHGQPDIFGRPLHTSRSNIADGLAAAAVVVMGETNEQRPLAVITGAPVAFCERVNRKELCIPVKDDVYKAIYTAKG